MGLFDFLKKPKTDTPTVTSKDGSSESERTSVFKGDLACISENSAEKKTDAVPSTSTNTGRTTENKDSADSVIFMTFAPIKKGSWICQECGTCNDEGLTGCIVCGLRR